jgi:hypothetical protein
MGGRATAARSRSPSPPPPPPPPGCRLLWDEPFRDCPTAGGRAARWRWFRWPPDAAALSPCAAGGDDGGHGFVANDARVRCTCDGLCMRARAFTKTVRDGATHRPTADGFLDHFKAWLLQARPTPLPQRGALYAEACVAAAVVGAHRHPFVARGESPGDGANGYPVPEALHTPSDLRLGYGAFTLFDAETGLNLAHAFTNDTHYAIYEVLPTWARTGVGAGDAVGAAFAGAYVLGRRRAHAPLADAVRVGISIDRHAGAAWYVNGVEVLRLPRLGVLPPHQALLYHVTAGGGAERVLSPRSVRVGFGLFTMLDAFAPPALPALPSNRCALVRLMPFSYWHPWATASAPRAAAEFACGHSRCPLRARLFGQGAILSVRWCRLLHLPRADAVPPRACPTPEGDC